MVLFVGGVKVEEVPVDSRSLFQMAPHLKERAAHFATTIPKMVGPMGLLYVAQREFAIVAPHDSNGESNEWIN